MYLACSSWRESGWTDCFGINGDVDLLGFILLDKISSLDSLHARGLKLMKRRVSSSIAYILDDGCEPQIHS